MRYLHHVTVEIQHLGLHVPVLIVIAPITALMLIWWLLSFTTPGPFWDLIFMVVIPVWAALTALGTDPAKEIRHVFAGIAAWSFCLSVMPLLFGFVNLSPSGFRLMAIERTVDQCDVKPGSPEATRDFESYSLEDLVCLSSEPKRRAALLKARTNKWADAKTLWDLSLLTTGQGQDSVSIAMGAIERDGVCQYQLLNLCTSLDTKDYKRQAVWIWRAYYPDVYPESWSALLNQY